MYLALTFMVPNTNIDLFIEDFNALIEPLKTSYKLILLGDYNIDLLKNNNHKNKFEICLQSNYLMPTIFSATRVEFKELENKVTSTETLIDNIFINNNIGYQSGIIETDISDHYSTFIIVPNITLDSQTEPDKLSNRLINQFHKRKFNNDLSKSDIMQVLNNYDAKSACEQFITNFDREYNQSFPITSKIPSFKDILKPWIDDTAIKRIKIRSNLKKLARKKIIEPKTYRRFRNKVTNELNLAKIKYFEYQFDTYATNIKKTWEVINSVIKSKKVNSKVSLSDESGNEYEQSTVPSVFINHYSTIADKLIKDIPTSQQNPENYLKNKARQSFIMTPINYKEV